MQYSIALFWVKKRNVGCFILGIGRTPMGGFQGVLSGLSAPELDGAAIGAALEDAKLDAGVVAEVLMGCVLLGRPGASACTSGWIFGWPW